MIEYTIIDGNEFTIAHQKACEIFMDDFMSKGRTNSLVIGDDVNFMVHNIMKYVKDVGIFSDPYYNEKQSMMKWSHGPRMYVFNSNDPARIRGHRFQSVWADQLQHARNEIEFHEGLKHCMGGSGHIVISGEYAPTRFSDTTMIQLEKEQ